MLLFLIMLSAYSFGVLAALAGPRNAVGRGFSALGAVIGAGAAAGLGVNILLPGPAFTLTAGRLLPLTGFALRVDELGALFLVIIGCVGVAGAIYGFGYSAAYEGRYSLRLLGAMFNVLLLSLCVLVMADNALTFLVAWEGMSLSAYWMVLTEHDQPGTVRAGVWYIAITHVGFVALVAMFLLLSGGELTTSFATMRANARTLAPLGRDAIFLLALLGFGSKAGLAPLHVWLPMAHPVAPSHVSAVMSGVMIKMGVYGFLRVALDLLGGGPTWWGALVLMVGAVSALLGILYALMENDLKRLLAYSSIENIGLIFIGVGAGLVFGARGLPAAAALAFTAALYHALNHAAFKSLLFMGAGSVLHATHTRDMNRLGGLIKRLPWTTLFFLIGSVAIAGLPPLNGFVSEWLMFQSLLPGVSITQPVVAALMTVVVGMLALTGGLVAAGFVKAFGITFLAIPRSPVAEHAHEAPLSMRFGMGLLALACAGLGLAPFAVLPVLGQVVAGLNGLPAVAPSFAIGLSVQMPEGFAEISPPLAALGLFIVLGLVPLGLWLARVNRRLRVSDTWGCGRVGQTPRMEYTATAFAEPLRRVFAELYRPTKELTVDFHPESKYFVQSIEFTSEIRSWFEEFVYEPVLGWVRRVSGQVRRVQSGSLHSYLAYIFIVLILMLGALLLPR